MVTYLTSPKFLITITHSTVDYYPDVIQGRVQRIENGFDSATLFIDNTDCRQYGSRLTAGDAITIQVKDASDIAYTTLLTGVISIASPIMTDSHVVKVECLGAGYGLGDTVCAQEYGSTSRNPSLDTISEIVTDASNGILPKWVNKILGSATDSGFSYTSTVEAIAGTIPYYMSPYKPCHKAINDVCDILTALKDGAAGPHWIVTPASAFLLTTIGSHSAAVIAAGWDTYYGGSAAAATLEEGVDFTSYTIEKLKPEANCIVYYGTWRRPSNGDGWTENTSSLWDTLATNTLTNDNAKYKVNSYSVRCTNDDAIETLCGMWYPDGKAAGWDFTSFSDFNTPSINFYFLRSAACTNVTLKLQSMTGAVVDGSYDVIITSDLVDADTWYHFSFPVGPYSNIQTYYRGFKWEPGGTPTWAGIDDVLFSWNTGDPNYCCVDGLHFGDADICRVAKNSTSITANKLKVKTITDKIGKDDSLVASDDSGTMARMAYAELLKAQTTPTVGEFTTSMVKDVLPGQLLHVHAQKTGAATFTVNMDKRIQKLAHAWTKDGATTTFNVTSDVTNSATRTRYGDWNTVFAAVRPDMQDRQATSIKGGDMDIRITKLEWDYP